MSTPGAPRQPPVPLMAAPDGAALSAAADLARECSSLILASSDSAGRPLASYAPFVVRNLAPHVFVSRLAAHFDNLQRGQVSVMLIQDQSQAPQAFARRRLVMDCEARPVTRSQPDHAPALAQLETRFGAVVATLRGLEDFELLRLEPVAGHYVQGFGQAFELDAEALRTIMLELSVGA